MVGKGGKRDLLQQNSNNIPHLSLHLSSCHSRGTTGGTWPPEDCHISDQSATGDTSRHFWGTSLPEGG